jgi:HEAT repeat protein
VEEEEMNRVAFLFVLLVSVGCATEPGWMGKAGTVWRKELRAKDPMARAHAASAIAAINPPYIQAIPDLIQCLHDPEENVRREAAGALVKMGPAAKQAVPTLLEMLKENNETVVHNARAALKRIDPEAAKAAGVK